MKNFINKSVIVPGIILSLFILIFLTTSILFANEVFTPQDLLSMRYVTSAKISPDGAWIAYTVRVPRKADDKPGGSYSELYVVSTTTGEIRPFITGKVSIRSIAWRPDGSGISFLTRRGDDNKTQVWWIPLDGGEARQLTRSKSGVISYAWHPSGKQMIYTATRPETAREKALKEKGYGFIYYEEDLKHRNLYQIELGGDDTPGEAEQLTEGVTVWTMTYSPDGNTIAATISPRNLIDHRYAFRKIYLLDVATRQLNLLVDPQAKLGNMQINPDGKYLTYSAALNRKDNQVSQVYVIPTSGGDPKNLTIPDFRGHVNWAAWKDNNTILYHSGEGTATTLSTVSLKGGKRKIILNSRDTGVIFNPPSFTRGFKHFALVCQSPEFPGELYSWQPGKQPNRLTASNDWLAEKKLGKQVVVKYNARDGLEIEGLLIYPAGYQSGQTYPLVVIVHGGPESHYSNGWVTRYSTPGQVLAGKGYVVFYPNYRASTGYGVEFAMQGYCDPAGKEFDDIADGIDYLIAEGIADKERVGLGGGSYGGFASAWFATYYTKYVKAVCMFVGISDIISKRSTTDIPYEEMFVHSGKMLEEMWDISLKRSPVYYAHQSKTATLIYGGAADTRVHPSQSLELYRRMKMNNHPAVRLVQYPGEGHGNRKQPGRIDVLYRILDWYDWYVKDAKPLDGPMPPLDISDKYGLELPE
ncbi:MAG: prolyl oligopeptidase family serine peptidase [Calditrichia bacterium]